MNYTERPKSHRSVTTPVILSASEESLHFLLQGHYKMRRFFAGAQK